MSSRIPFWPGACTSRRPVVRHREWHDPDGILWPFACVRQRSVQGWHLNQHLNLNLKRSQTISILHNPSLVLLLPWLIYANWRHVRCKMEYVSIWHNKAFTYLQEPSATKIKLYPLRVVCLMSWNQSSWHAPNSSKMETRMSHENLSLVVPKFLTHEKSIRPLVHCIFWV